jgi:hypothetical protein
MTYSFQKSNGKVHVNISSVTSAISISGGGTLRDERPEGRNRSFSCRQPDT